MEPALYYIARAGVGLIQALPLTWVARLGRWGGGLAYWLDRRHRRVVLRNLTFARIRVLIGPAIPPPENDSRENVEASRLQTEFALNGLHDRIPYAVPVAAVK